MKRTFFIMAAEIIRVLPKIRGKVRLGLFIYKVLNLKKNEFHIITKLYAKNYRYRLNLNCSHELMAYLMGQYEITLINFLAGLYSTGTFLDIGANVGFISIPFAGLTSRDPGHCHVYAIEALKSNYDALTNNIDLNKMSSAIKALNIGLGSENKRVFIQIEGDNPELTGTANILPSNYEFTKIPLTITAIDNLIEANNLPNDISLVKIDTDGYDFEILRGAARLLKNQRPLIFSEMAEHCLNWHGQSISDVAHFVSGLGYELWVKKKGDDIRFEKYNSARNYVQDCLLIPSENIAQYKYLLL
jgi:FkbM family methyltransferase